MVEVGGGDFFHAPATKRGGAYNFTLVHMYCHPSVTLCSSLLVSATPPTVFDTGILNLSHGSDMH